MAEYHYAAVNASGKTVKGNIEASDIRAAKALVKAQDLRITEISEATIFNKELSIELGGKVTSRDLGIFCRQMNSVLNAGVPVVRALAMLGEQTEKKKFRSALMDVQMRVEKGETLTDGMRHHKDVFPFLLINIVQAGEESGSLDMAFSRMATHFEKSAKLSGMVKKAMIYPIMIIIVAVVVVGIMSAFVIPQFASMFEDMGAELPLITRIVMGVSNFVVHKWYILIIAIVALVLGIRYALSTDQGKHYWGRLSLRLPVFGNIARKNASASFARTLTTLVASGLDMPRAIEITADSMSNVLFKDALMEAKLQVERGIPMSNHIKQCGLFPSMVGNMLAIGEETGQMEEMLAKVADYYEEEVEIATGSLTAAMEPMIIIIMGIIVGFIVLAIYSPMINMYSGMDNL